MWSIILHHRLDQESTPTAHHGFPFYVCCTYSEQFLLDGNLPTKSRFFSLCDLIIKSLIFTDDVFQEASMASNTQWQNSLHSVTGISTSVWGHSEAEMAKFKREGEMLIHRLVSLAQILGAETHFKMELSFSGHRQMVAEVESSEVQINLYSTSVEF